MKSQGPYTYKERSHLPPFPSPHLPPHPSSTLLQAYDAYLEEMGIMAQNRHEYAGLLVSEAGDRLHALALRKEEARKRHMQFAAKLLQDRTKNAADTKKARLKWMEACEAAETSRLKMERRTDERSYAKVRDGQG